MTSIGIVTRHCYPNYGSFLQSLALSDAFVHIGAQVSIIDYVPRDDSPLGLVSSSLRESRMRSGLAKRVAFIGIQGPNLVAMATRFRSYQRSGLPLSRKICSADELVALARSFDRVVTGSDQVWNLIHARVDPAYYLSGVRSLNKYSYAASFGGAVPPTSSEPRVAGWLHDLATVSVREASSLPALEELGVRGRVDVDPVLLHDRDYWSDFAGAATNRKGSYILVYQLHNTPRFEAALASVARQHPSLPVRRVTADAKQRLRQRASDYLARPEAFVRLIRDAAVVVTDSFHGTAFALTMGTPIRVVPPEKNAARLHDVMSMVGLGDRASADFAGKTDYDTRDVDDRIRAGRDESLKYLERVVVGR